MGRFQHLRRRDDYAVHPPEEEPSESGVDPRKALFRYDFAMEGDDLRCADQWCDEQ